ncbi:unnamed protein product [Caenorhabditis bovis]|uniref:Uncharacterized protein n=1 Tax=Caenorhabditis bovis TaxID=2654633 RepID=A0A8S1ESZ1_9PELO|nr:unnamed protein product [Caenorhabditis bovis]
MAESDIINHSDSNSVADNDVEVPNLGVNSPAYQGLVNGLDRLIADLIAHDRSIAEERDNDIDEIPMLESGVTEVVNRDNVENAIQEEGAFIIRPLSGEGEETRTQRVKRSIQSTARNLLANLRFISKSSAAFVILMWVLIVYHLCRFVILTFWP